MGSKGVVYGLREERELSTGYGKKGSCIRGMGRKGVVYGLWEEMELYTD